MSRSVKSGSAVVCRSCQTLGLAGSTRLPASSENSRPCIRALLPRSIAVQAKLRCGPFLTRQCKLGRAKCSQRQYWRGPLLGRRSTLARSKYHFSQRQRMRRCREQTLVSSWAPVQWLRRGWRAHGHNGAASVVQVPLSLHQKFRSAGSARGLTLPSRGRPTAGFASCRPPLMSNVRALAAGAITLFTFGAGRPRSGRRTNRDGSQTWLSAAARSECSPGPRAQAASAPGSSPTEVQTSSKMHGTGAACAR